VTRLAGIVGTVTRLAGIVSIVTSLAEIVVIMTRLAVIVGIVTRLAEIVVIMTRLAVIVGIVTRLCAVQPKNPVLLLSGAGKSLRMSGAKVPVLHIPLWRTHARFYRPSAFPLSWLLSPGWSFMDHFSLSTPASKLPTSSCH